MRRVAALALAGALAAAPAAEARAPAVEQMVVFRSGKAVAKRTSSRGVLVTVGRRRCAAGTGTALAALVRSKVARLRLRDFGACSRRARDGGGLFVSGVGRDRNRGRHGWVYKVGRKAATAGAADPTGPFGTGRRLRPGQRLTWLYCRLGSSGSCQRTLELRATPEPGGAATTVRGYDDQGRGVAVEGATVRLGAATQVTDANGVARFAIAPGSYRAYATKPGLVRSFGERVVVR
jgi:uncharacterized membrane protein